MKSLAKTLADAGLPQFVFMGELLEKQITTTGLEVLTLPPEQMATILQVDVTTVYDFQNHNVVRHWIDQRAKEEVKHFSSKAAIGLASKKDLSSAELQRTKLLLEQSKADSAGNSKQFIIIPKECLPDE